MKRIIFTVTTDLVFDQRMKRICSSIHGAGYDVLLIGRKKRSSPPISESRYKQKRLVCFFEKGKLFYLEYNIRLLIYLMTVKCDAICGIDLDTLLPATVASRLRRKFLIYDAHEYFTQMEEVVNRPFTRGVWKWIERLCVPRCDAAYTVSDGYGKLFEEEYDREFQVVRNITILRDSKPIWNKEAIILYQGAVNIGRGLENVIEAMQKVDGKLIVCGDGDILSQLKELVKSLSLQAKVQFMGYVKPQELIKFTRMARLGLTLFEAEGLSNRYSLANRFFDYIHSGVPQLAMNYPEYKNFNSKFEVAALLDDLEPFTLASAMNKVLKDDTYYSRLHENAIEARKTVNWQNEERVLIGVYDQLFSSDRR